MKRTAGISLMLLIFLSLCMITFSLLSLSGAKADASLSQKTADRTTSNYAAVAEANRLLSQIDAVLAASWSEVQEDTAADAADVTAAWLSLCRERLATLADALPLSGYSFEETGEACSILSYNVAVSETQQLQVTLTLSAPENEADCFYTITGWQIVSTQEWSGDTAMNLYQFD